MFTPGSSVHAGYYSAETRDNDSQPQNPYSAPVILPDQRRSHTADMAAEMQARAETRDRIDAMVGRLSRFAGLGLFAVSLGAVSWMVAGWL
ncbi:MAG: hypothetical protein ABW169_04425 [Sphingobium sp.]